METKTLQFVYRVAPQTWRQGLARIPGRGNSTEREGTCLHKSGGFSDKRCDFFKAGRWVVLHQQIAKT